MLNVEKSVMEKFPALASKPPIISNSTINFLRKLIHEDEINGFLHKHQGLAGFDFIDQIFEYFNFSYSASTTSRNNIPAEGKVVIIANHPIGSLDGLALLRFVSEVRRDVKIVANDMLMAFEPLHSLLIPLDNMTKGGYRQSYKNVRNALKNEQAIIIFPSGEVSRAGPQGVRDGKWQSGFLHFARKAQAPIVPIHIKAKNSLLFYSASMLFKPLGTALLAREMFNKNSAEIKFRVGEPIAAHTLSSDKLTDKALIHRLKKHLYKIGRGKKTMFVTEKTIAHPEERRALRTALKDAERLGETRDDNLILLVNHESDSAVMREIGRLREDAFRRVGEGTGSRRDLDNFDYYYKHLVVWDDEQLNIAGSYRIGDASRIIKERDINALYAAQLFNYQDRIIPYLSQSLELGRSFVNPQYWGKASLDYLWQGIGAYLSHNPHIRYLLGPVSVSATYPKTLRDALVFYYQRFFSNQEVLALPKNPYLIDSEQQALLEASFADKNRDQAFSHLQQLFTEQGHKLPVLYKQYAALFEKGGFQLLGFSVDPDFADCLDGLFIADLSLLKESKRKRYISE